MPKKVVGKVVKERKRIPRTAKRITFNRIDADLIKETVKQENILKRVSRDKTISRQFVHRISDESKIMLKSVCQNDVKQEVFSDDSSRDEKSETFTTQQQTCEMNVNDEMLSHRLNKPGFLHFMDLEERKDLLHLDPNDPLRINGPEPFESVVIKEELPDDVEICNITFTEVRLNSNEEPNFLSPCILQSSLNEDCSNLETINYDFLNESKRNNFSADSKDFKEILKFKEANFCITKEEIVQVTSTEKSEGEEKEKDYGNIKEEECSEDDCNYDGFIINESHSNSSSDIILKKTIKLNSKTKNKPFSCDICNKQLSSKGSMRLHKFRKHKIRVKFNCELCPMKYNLQRDLVKHRNDVHARHDGKFTCDECDKICKDYYMYLNHIKDHYEDGDIVFQSHKDGCRVNDAIFKCEKCDVIFKKEGGLRIHNALVHDSDGGIMKKRLKQQDKNYVCHTCGKKFAFGCLLKDHINTHTGTKPYSCQICGRSFAQKASLKQHKRTHNAVRPFNCNVCVQAFYSKGDLTKHMRKHTGERPFVCEICGEGFSQSSHLAVHRRSHTGERPFQCDICSRGFTKKGDVVRHRRIHTGELPYLCQVCGKAFRQSTQCVNHIKNHHSESFINKS